MTLPEKAQKKCQKEIAGHKGNDQIMCQNDSLKKKTDYEKADIEKACSVLGSALYLCCRGHQIENNRNCINNYLINVVTELDLQGLNPLKGRKH